MNLPHADYRMPEDRASASQSAGRLPLQHAAAAGSVALATLSAPVHSLDPIAILTLDKNGCVKAFNTAAEDLFGKIFIGQAWPLLRNAFFWPRCTGYSLLSRGGDSFIEQHSADASTGERIVCIQRSPRVNEQSAHALSTGEQIAKLVHQVRTPLTAAGLYLDQLVRQLAHEPKLLNLAKKSIVQLRSADDIFSAATGQLRDPAKIIGVSALLDQLNEQCAGLVLSLGAHLHCAEYKGEAYIRADVSALVSALSNLVINAAQHPQSKRLLRICVSAHRVGECILIEISDTGKGVPEHLEAKVFDPFETSRSDGTGLGLSIARDTLAQFDGQIELTRNAEGGATFSVRFPAQAMDVAA